jgi:hypothetical protein
MIVELQTCGWHGSAQRPVASQGTRQFSDAFAICSTKVQQPHRLRLTAFDLCGPVELRQRPSTTSMSLDGKERVREAVSLYMSGTRPRVYVHQLEVTEEQARIHAAC